MNTVTLWARLKALMPSDKVAESLKGCLAPQPVQAVGLGLSVRKGSSVDARGLRAPIGQLLLGFSSPKPSPLPFDVISILDRERGSPAGDPLRLAV